MLMLMLVVFVFADVVDKRETRDEPRLPNLASLLGLIIIRSRSRRQLTRYRNLQTSPYHIRKFR